MRTLALSALFACAASTLAAQQPLFAPSATALDHGSIGAGEGPVWHPGKGLYFSGQGKTWLRTTDGKVAEVDLPGGATNGLLVDRELGLIACQPGSRRVVRLDPDGKLTLLAERYQGGRFNSPNDLTVDAKGRIYFSDPRYGSREGMEILDDGGRAVEGVYRIDGPGRVVRILTHEVDRPNGLLVSPDDRYLYVADNNNTPGAARQLVRFDLRLDGSLDPASKKILFDWGNGRGADGFEMDSVGRLWVAAGRNEPNPPNETIDFPGGVYVLSPEGELLGLLPIAGDEVTNVAFAGPRLKTLFVTAGGTLWSMETAVPGLSVLSRP